MFIGRSCCFKEEALKKVTVDRFTHGHVFTIPVVNAGAHIHIPRVGHGVCLHGSWFE